MSTTRSRKPKQDKETKGRAPEGGQEQPQGGGTAAPTIEAEGGKVTVQGVDVEAAGAIPTGIPLPDGSVFMVIAPGIKHDPEIDPGREPEEYAADHPKMLELVASMKAFAGRNPLGIGNDVPVVARRGEGGELLLVAGRRRDAGAGYAGTKLAVLVRNISVRDARIDATVENGQREGPSVLGEARQFRDLREKDGMKVEEIAAATGKQQAYVSKRLALLTLPEWAQAMLRTGELTEGTAYEGMARFVRVPEPAASEMWATLLRRWPELKREGLTAERIRNALGQIARNLSRSVDPSVSYAGETAPLFDLAAHDAKCTCKRPKIRLHDTMKEHARCYNVPVWEGLQETARAERRKALQGNGNGNGNGHAKPNGNGGTPAPAAEAPAAAPTTSRTASPTGPEPTPRYDAPTWAEAEEAFGAKARDHVLTDDHTAAEIQTAPPCKLLDVSALSADVVSIVQSPRPGLFRVVCTDAEALKRATAGAERAVRERADRIREQERATFRETAGAVELRSTEVLAALVFNYGTPPASFGMNTAELVGLGDLRQKTAADLAQMPKRDLTLLLQAIALRVMKGDTTWRHDDRTDTARQQLAAECTEDFRTLMSAVSGPELTNAGRLQVRAGRIAGLWDEVEGLIRRQEGEAGAFADELSEYAPAWAETVATFRAECNALAAEGVAFGLDLDGIANPHADGSLADLIGGAGAMLQHPVFARIDAEAAKPRDDQPTEGGEGGAEPPAPEAGAEQPTEDGEGAEAPAPEAGAGAGAGAGAEGEAEGGEGNVIRVPGGTHTVRRGKKDKRRK